MVKMHDRDISPTDYLLFKIGITVTVKREENDLRTHGTIIVHVIHYYRLYKIMVVTIGTRLLAI